MLATRVSQALRFLGATVLAGLLLGISIALTDFREFARVSGALPLVLPVAGGVLLGVLIPRLSQALAVLLPMLIAGGAIAFGALVYPEYSVGRLGMEIAADIALEKALQGVVLAAPLSIAGLLLGHFVGARWSEPA